MTLIREKESLCLMVVVFMAFVGCSNQDPDARPTWESIVAKREQCGKRIKTTEYFNTTLLPFIRANMPGADSIDFKGTTLKDNLATLGFTVYEPSNDVMLRFEAEARMDLVKCYPIDVKIYQIYDE